MGDSGERMDGISCFDIWVILYSNLHNLGISTKRNVRVIAENSTSKGGWFVQGFNPKSGGRSESSRCCCYDRDHHESLESRVSNTGKKEYLRTLLPRNLYCSTVVSESIF